MLKTLTCMSFCLLAPIICCSGDITITVVYNNIPHDARLETSWGMACVVQGLEQTILFDTGSEGAILISNMEKCDIYSEQIDVVVLSHIHADHVGGLWDFLDRNTAVTVYVPRTFPEKFKNTVRQTGANLVSIAGPAKICTHAFSTGELGDGIHEQSLVIDTSRGIVVITGCAHPGIVNIVKKARQIMDNTVFLVCGGFHLGGYSARQVDAIIQEFKNLGIETVGPSHCTGDRAIEQFRKAWGAKFTEFGCGASVYIK